uniref:Uncharacterized protein n=1 Tax=Oryza punctata TaxID=4537 RepID=A0A0E0K0A2_ORYPU
MWSEDDKRRCGACSPSHPTADAFHRDITLLVHGCATPWKAPPPSSAKAMEEDPLISLAWLPKNSAVAAVHKSDKENHRPEVDVAAGFDVEAEIGHIEAEILRLSSRLHHRALTPPPPLLGMSPPPPPLGRNTATDGVEEAPAAAATAPEPAPALVKRNREREIRE